MKYRYYNEDYNVKFTTLVEIKRNEFILFMFRIWHFIKRLKRYLINYNTVILFIFCGIYFLMQLMLSGGEDKYAVEILVEALKKCSQVLLLTFCVPTITNAVVKESERKKALNYRYWEALFNVLNARSSLEEAIEEQNFSEEKIRKCMISLKSYITIIDRNCRNYGLNNEEIEAVQESCISIISNAEYIQMGTLNSDKFEKTIKEIEKELLDLHRLIVEIWRRDTIYNKKIISAIKKDDDSICQNKGYEIYMEDDNAL